VWKFYVRLALVSLIFLAAFSGLWAYSSSGNSSASFQPQVELDIHNNTSSIDFPLTFPSTQHMVSYGNGGKLFFYDGLKFNSSLNPGKGSLMILVNSSLHNGSSQTTFCNFTQGQVTGQISLSLAPGYYSIGVRVIISVALSENVNLTQALPSVSKNVSGKFIATLVKPEVAVFTYPVIVSASSTVLFSVISYIDFRRKFSG
jgi:hypothetical protein